MLSENKERKPVRVTFCSA